MNIQNVKIAKGQVNGHMMNNTRPSVAPKEPQWVMGLSDNWYPKRCINCWEFPIIPVSYIKNDIKFIGRACPYCKVEVYL
jgi:hypothetical protein